MITENLSTLKIHKLTQEQYDREFASGNIDESALYLTPTNETVGIKTPDGGEIFNDYENNAAIGDLTHSEGQGNIAGAKGFDILSIGEGSFTLDDVTGLAVGDVYSLKYDNNWLNYGSIQSIDPETNTVIVDNIPANDSLELDDEGNVITGTLLNTFNVANKPTVGTKYIATGAHAEGRYNKALRDATHVEGILNTALGRYAHVEGNGNTAYHNAHAEGIDNVSQGYHSHSEGGKNQVVGDYSHVEGLENIVTGKSAHAEGFINTVSGNYSHTEGCVNTSSAYATHTEGYENEATVKGAHAEGHKNKSNAYAAHTEGRYNTVTKDAGHAEGNTNTVTGTAAHAEGKNNTVSGASAHVEGEGNTEVAGSASHAEGKNNTVTSTATAAHAEGSGNTVSGTNSHAEGGSNTASGNQSHVEGYENTASAYAAHAEGQNTQALHRASHTSGLRTKTSSDFQTVVGKDNADAPDSFFVVGNGSGDAARSNAFTVNKDGTASVQSDPTSELHVANKKYVDSAMNSAKGYSDELVLESINNLCDVELYIMNQRIETIESSGSYTDMTLPSYEEMEPGVVYMGVSNKTVETFMNKPVYKLGISYIVPEVGNTFFENVPLVGEHGLLGIIITSASITVISPDVSFGDGEHYIGSKVVNNASVYIRPVNELNNYLNIRFEDNLYKNDIIAIEVKFIRS